MGTESSKPKKSVAPETDLIDLAWDDDPGPAASPIPALHAMPPLDESQFDRVTAIPEEPSADYVRNAMRVAEEQEEKSGVQPITDASGRATPIGVELDMPGLDHDDLDLDLRSAKSPDPMQLGMGSLELDLETPVAPPTEDRTVSQMRDRYAAGDFTGALVLAEGLLESEPDHADALRFAESCRDVLTQMYAARLGDLGQRVRVAIPPDQVRWLSLDHRAGFLLSLVDGGSTLEEILDISGMPRLDALRIMFSLYEQQIIALGGDGTRR